MEKIVKALQEGHAQLSKAFEDTNKRLDQVFDEQHQRKRDRDCLDQHINKLFNAYHNMKPQPPGHVMDNPYHQEDIKADSILLNKERSRSQYQDGDNMSYSEKEALKQLPEASSWPKFSGIGEYVYMELIYYIDGLFILYEESQTPDPYARDLEHAVKCRCNHNCTLDYIANSLQDIRKRTNIGNISPYKSSGFKEKQAFRVEFKYKPRERVEEVAKKKNSFHNCGSADHYANNCPKAKKKVYVIEKIPEEESPTKGSEWDSMGDAIRAQSDAEQDPR
ncbi:hypothetical protein O181_041027 [Austropuccinia psidii MF-1]|uniref:Uncharacterized protein n=1 Tax=Austropuccinia psidii MF-1 TaxID=1389203 RepID=A0A9Q3HEG2_9BASI|nr:hypothetical protein [Austropuccinia psidii MF-1]